MFSTMMVGDITQLALKRQLRENTSILYLIKGVERSAEFVDVLKMYASKCKSVYYNTPIEKPTYDETSEVTNKIGANLRFEYKFVLQNVRDIFVSMDAKMQESLAEAISQVFTECVNNHISVTMIKNGYYRCLVTLNKRLSTITYNLNEDNRVLYVGKPDKFDILTFTVLGLCGVDVVIIDFDKGQTSECMCMNRFILIEGNEKNVDISFLSYNSEGIRDISKNIVSVNGWVNFKDYSELEDILKLCNFNVTDRYEQDMWKVLHIEIQGVKEKLSFANSLETFMLNLSAEGRKFVLFDGSIPKATYDENEKYRKNFENKSIVDIISNYSVFKNSGIGPQMDMAFNKLIKDKAFPTAQKSKTYENVLKIWLVRYLDMFFNTNKIEKIPICVTFLEMSEREKDFLKLLGCLPIDIVSFYPKYQIAYNITGVDDTFKVLCIGEISNDFLEYPKNTGVGKVATTAFNAERELDRMLYSDTSLFRIKQFKDINPIVLKTTYEEVDILWNEPAKFRPSFESAGNLVTVPTIFTKINGVNETYVGDIKKKLGTNTLFFDSFPIQLQPSIMDNGKDFRSFTKQLIFQDKVDFERLKKSKYYNYSVFSEETQNLIFDKVDKLIKMNWCACNEKNLPYEILDTVFRIPQNIMQIIHNYDFTAEIPKIIIYNGSSQPCSLSDCILIMFLKLIGFDILIYSPTGYRIVEQYISNQWFNEITIGQFDFNKEHIDFNSFSNYYENNGSKKQGFFSRLFGE